METTLQTTIAKHRDKLFRWFLKRAGDVHVAEDLTQETLLEAWNNRHKLTDIAGIPAWLNAIANNIHKRWTRQHGRDTARFTDLAEASSTTDSQAEFALTRNDLIGLLDRALNELSPESRQIILMRYLEELPQAKVAQMLGLSESVVAVKLHRGKLQLRTRLHVEERGDASTHQWQQTNIWCASCGNSRYEGKLDSTSGELHLRCPMCSPTPDFLAWEYNDTREHTLLQGLSTFKPAMNRVMNHLHSTMSQALKQGEIPCETCQQLVPLQLDMPDNLPLFRSDHPGVHYRCPKCQHLNYSALSGIALSTPEVQRFWRDYPRMRQQAVQRVEHEGRAVVIIGAESVRQPNAKIAAFFAEDTYQLLKVVRTDESHD